MISVRRLGLTEGHSEWSAGGKRVWRIDMASFRAIVSMA
jgi:hypothetical protein